MSSDLDLCIDLESALGELTSDNPAIVRLWASGYTLAEIGEIYGFSKMGIKKRINRSLVILRRSMDG